MEGPRQIASELQLSAPARGRLIPTDFFGLLNLLRRYWLLMLGCCIACVVAMVASSILISGRSYEVTAKVMVNLGPEMIGSPLLAVREGTAAAPAMRRPEDSATGAEIFANPRLVRELVKQLGERFFADPPAVTVFQRIKQAGKQAVSRLRASAREASVLLGITPRTTQADRLALAIGNALRVEPVRRSDVINLILTFPDPRAGEVILNRFISIALAGHIHAYRTPGVTEFFRNARAERRAEFDAVEKRLLAMRVHSEQPVWSVAEQRSGLIRSESDLQQQLRQVSGAIAATEAEIARAETTLGTLPGEIDLTSVQSRNPAADALHGRLAQLRLDLAVQQSRYGEDSTEISDIRRQMAALMELLKAEVPYRLDQVTKGVSQLHQSLVRDIVTRRIDLEGQRGRARRLAQDIGTVREQLQDIETAAIGIAQLEQDLARLRRSLDVYERGYDDARIAEAMEAVQLSGLRVIMPPTAEILPSSPSLRRTLLLGLAAGLVLAFAVVLFLEYRASLSGTTATG